MLFQWRRFVLILDDEKMTGATSNEPYFERNNTLYPEPMFLYLYVDFASLITDNHGDAYY